MMEYKPQFINRFWFNACLGDISKLLSTDMTSCFNNTNFQELLRRTADYVRQLNPVSNIAEYEVTIPRHWDFTQCQQIDQFVSWTKALKVLKVDT